MGQEIGRSSFTPADFARFGERLREETALLADALDDGRFAEDSGWAGLELEAWLIDANGRPAPLNAPFIQAMDNPLVVPELARFNIELNSTPVRLHGDVLSRMQDALSRLWQACAQCAAGRFQADVLMIGILPTLRESDLSLACMSPLKRYAALNEQILEYRGGRPLRLDIRGRDHLRTAHRDVMLEAATTSFQLHLQVAPHEAARVYNAALILSAPMVAASANSPYLFGRDLWDETRIPLFEQAVALDDVAGPACRAPRRAGFGTGYVRDSIMACFRENLALHPVLLPLLGTEAADRFGHLRLHNGTIWRWNRPLVGFDAAGTPHLRIEHRVMPAGPSVVDAIANAALFFGALHALARQPEAPEVRLSFDHACANFYAAARDGLEAEVTWLDGRRGRLRELILESILPLARQGLLALDIDARETAYYLGIVAARVAAGRNGAAWQRAFVARRGSDLAALTAAYLSWQRSGLPVHRWALDGGRAVPGAARGA